MACKQKGLTVETSGATIIDKLHHLILSHNQIETKNIPTKDTTGTGTANRRFLYCLRCLRTDSISFLRAPI